MNLATTNATASRKPSKQVSRIIEIRNQISRLI